MRAFVTVGLAAISITAVGETLPRYEACELAPVPGVFFSYEARALNDHGDVVGSAAGPTTQPAFIWDRFQGARELGTLPGDWLGRANAINNWRLVAGSSTPLPGSSSAVVWIPWIGIHRVTSEADAYQPGNATGLNEWGQVVGGDGNTSFVWDPWRGVTQLDPVPGLDFSMAYDINNHGTVLVSGFGPTTASSALISTRTWKQEPVPLESAYKLNDRGQVIGLTQSSATSLHAAVWDRVRGIRDLGDLPGGDDFSEARDINNAGTVVGLSLAEDGYRAFVWTAKQGLVDLNTLVVPNSVPTGMVFSDAVAINNRGWILVNARLQQAAHTYVLRPERRRSSGAADPGCLAPDLE